MSADMNTTRDEAVRWFAERRLAGMAGVPNGYDYDDADALIAAGWQPPGGVVVDTEQLARVLCQIEGRGENRSIDEVVAPGRELWMRWLPEAEAIVASGLFTSRTEALAQGWDEALNALAWTADHGEGGIDLAYVAANNPYRKGA